MTLGCSQVTTKLSQFSRYSMLAIGKITTGMRSNRTRLTGGGRKGATKRSGNTRLLIVVSPGTPGVVGLADDQRRYTLFVERPKMHEIPLPSPSLFPSCEIRPDVSSSGNEEVDELRRGEPRGSSPTRAARTPRNQNRIRFGDPTSTGTVAQTGEGSP